MNEILQVQKNTGGSVLNHGALVFDETLHLSGNILYDAGTGQITLSDKGSYLIDWYAATQTVSGASGAIFKLLSADGAEFIGNSPNKTGNASGFASISVEDTPVILWLANESGGSVFFPAALPAKAGLRVFSLGDGAEGSACFALEQFAHVLEQIVTLYEGASISIFSGRLATITGSILSLYKSPDAGSIPLLLLQDTPPYAFAIDKITVLYMPGSVYDPSITYLPFPESAPQNCETDLIKNIHDYISVGDTIEFMTGVTTNASGVVSVNEYGIIVLADQTSTIFVFTPQIFSIRVTAPAEPLPRPLAGSSLIIR